MLLDDKTSPDADDALAAAIANTHAIVLAAHLDSATEAEHWLEPDPLFLQKHVRLGHVHTDPDFDNINRRILSVKEPLEGRVIPAFAVQALHAAGLPFKADFEQKVGPPSVSSRAHQYSLCRRQPQFSACSRMAGSGWSPPNLRSLTIKSF